MQLYPDIEAAQLHSAMVPEFGQQADAVSGAGQAPLDVVVGFDGSRSSLQALRTAQQLADAGRLHVVYVAHVPLAAALSASSVAGMREGFDVIARELESAASSILDAPGAQWTFERRDGGVAHELFRRGGTRPA